MRRMKTWLTLLLALLALIPGFSFAQDGDGPKAQDVSAAIKFEVKGRFELPKKVIGNSMAKYEDFSPYEVLFFHFDPKVNAHWLCIQWTTPPEGVRIRQMDGNDVVLSEADVPERYDTVVALEQDTARVALISDRRGMSLAKVALYTEGALPSPFCEWQYAQGHLDYLIIATHPDDDVLFMGGVIPVYGREQGRVGTVAYVTSPSRMRVNEGVMGVRAMGGQVYPLFLDFMDLSQRNHGMFVYRFMPEAVTRAIVRLLRQQRPLVVFSHDANGEYGHWQHKIVSAAVVDACKLAADESYDPESAAEYGVWEVKKCYLHLCEENPLVMDVTTPLASMGGQTAVQVAQEAFKAHRSQYSGRHTVQTDTDRDAMNRFGMAYGTVEAGEDAFDNIDPSLFVSALSAESEPAA